ncbi:class I SAM-dependent methyltransferase [Actinoallomurus soli]|uniref:class I SAM-dependent methyltransferase n=1 Tax=Actinoallomurus soli TaxID=2952535 RepID=UPI002093E0BD|nr:class I SAM-dependent methyltransferase [Actinoallomurus soli]MCO5972509.1 class I SAM-dependent methyltransferase [Actinoallomurus soli]
MTTPAQTMAERTRQMWAAVDYHPIAVQDVLVSELLARAADVHSGHRVLDVAAGSGNSALAAARRGARVTATDIVPAALETAVRRAAAEGLQLEVEVADAQDLPFEDGTFDVVLSSFGAMYAPDQQRTVGELLRVCRPGGRIAMANWTPDGVVARLQRVMASVMPPPAQAAPPRKPPVAWGSEQHCRELFGDRVTSLSATVRVDEMCAPSAGAQVELMAGHLAPWHMATKVLPPESQQKLAEAAAAEYERVNRATDGTLVARAEYLEVVAVKA